jgi:hypothetical protein
MLLKSDEAAGDVVMTWKVTRRWHGRVNYFVWRASVSFFLAFCNLLPLLTATAQDKWICDSAWDRRCEERVVMSVMSLLDGGLLNRCRCWRRGHCGWWQTKICCAALAAVNHQSVLAVVGLWVAVAGGLWVVVAGLVAEVEGLLWRCRWSVSEVVNRHGSVGWCSGLLGGGGSTAVIGWGAADGKGAAADGCHWWWTVTLLIWAVICWWRRWTVFSSLFFQSEQ